ncbi:speckle-type POZ protein B [Trichonephila inaurata madagascariensis]|uniref:Speckle-type POZ protein B n=1 Tax=Trichonephila inaurata madagascariensis TaxID=2747483 RepID=A0A8X6Y2C6_9ARAC|nr:speckle-type POZ protein B [Trichonephila inaurata madagascariensis]
MSANEEESQLSCENVSLEEYKDVAECLDPVDFFIVTRVPVETYRFKWILNQFSNISSNKEVYSCLYSSCYRLKFIKYENGFGLFHVNDIEVNNRRRNENRESPSLSIFLPVFNSDPVQQENVREDFFHHVIEYKVAVADKRGRERIKWKTCFSNDKDYGSYTIGEYRCNSWKTFFGEVLVLNCRVKVTKNPKTEKQNLDTKCSLESHCWEKLSQDLKSMYLNSLNADCTLEVKSEEILVNSSILAARSSVFKKMLHHDKEQKVQNPVAITDVPLPAMKRLVQFLYTGSVEEAAKDIPLQEVYDLYYAADKYEVMDLRKMCGTTLMSKTSVDNACQILLWADRHSDESLKSQALNFISLNFETVVDSDVWRHLTDDETKLANEALGFCALKFKAGADK